MSENEMILAGGADLVKQSELYEPMLYYGSKARITVDYVSDIHLLHHAPYFHSKHQIKPQFSTTTFKLIFVCKYYEKEHK